MLTTIVSINITANVLEEMGDICLVHSDIMYEFFIIFFLCTGLATVHPEPTDYESFIKAQLYDPRYKSSIPPIYSWPKL